MNLRYSIVKPPSMYNNDIYREAQLGEFEQNFSEKAAIN